MPRPFAMIPRTALVLSLAGALISLLVVLLPIRGAHGDSVLACGNLVNHKPISYGLDANGRGFIGSCPPGDFQQRRYAAAVAVPMTLVLFGLYAAIRRKQNPALR